MWNLIKRVSAKYQGWVGDSELERAVRRYLVGQGYYGDTARFESFRLVAVQRPGWLQVFSFAVDAKQAVPEDEEVDVDAADTLEADNNAAIRRKLFGIVRQDVRYNRCDIQVFDEAASRNALFDEWSEELIRLRKPKM